MLRTSPVRLGVIGAGRAATGLHLPAWRRIPQIQIVAVADSDPARASALASQLPGAAVADPAAILTDPRVDAVAILTPPATHGALLLAALDARKHAFVEKPLTSTPAEADRLVEKVRTSGLVVAVGHNLRCHRLVKQARALLHGGILGDLLAMRAVWTSSGPPREEWRRQPDGGIWLDLAVHHVDLFQHLAGCGVESITASETHGDSGRQTGAISGRLHGGVVFTSVLSQQGVSEHTFHLSGTKGSIEFSCHRANSFRLISAAHLGLRAQIAEAQQYLAQIPALVSSARTGGDWLDSYRSEWEAFRASVQHQAPLACPVEDAAAAIQVCLTLSGRTAAASHHA